jgi:hypothetical protein
MPVIETGPSEWRSETRPSSYIRELEHFQEKHALGLDPGVVSGFPSENATNEIGASSR